MFSLLFLLTVDDTARLLSFTFAFLSRCKTKTTTTTMFWGGVPSLKVDKQRKCGGQKKKEKKRRKSGKHTLATSGSQPRGSPGIAVEMTVRMVARLPGFIASSWNTSCNSSSWN